jgi:hypothetical protein
MIYIISVIIYILSFISSRFSYRLCSSRYLDIWENKDCKVELWMFIPIINTIFAIATWCYLSKYLKFPKSKFFNSDLDE